MASAGIHFGNTNSVIAVYKDGKVEIVSNETGDRVTPTIVAYTGSEKLVGQPAKQYLTRNPSSCISQIKSSIGQSFTDDHINQIKDGASCEISNVKGSISFKVKVEDNFVKVSSIKAASYIFTKLLEIAEHVGGSDLEDVVLAVPHNFSEEQKLSLCEAAEDIGCNVLRVISEPAAALLAYGIGQEDPTVHGNILVYRLGGSSMDATVMNVNSGMYRVFSQKCNPNFGGKDFDKVLVQHFQKEFQRKYKEDISSNKRAIGKLTTAVETCKHGLTRMQSTSCAVDSLYDGLDFHSQIPRAKYESLCSHLFTQCLQLIDESLQSSNLTESQIDTVILAGGGSNMPRLINLVKERFKSSEFLTKYSPEELLARGAALQAALLQGREDINASSPSLQCLSKNIGIKISKDGNEQMEVIINKNTPVPTRRSRTFKCDAQQTSVCVCVCESVDTNIETSRLLAKLAMKDLNENSEKELLINFEVNRNGYLQVTLTEKVSNRTEQLTIEIEHT
ncbi:heat shock 70 kDa protein 14-like [Hydractinia symbiolongicarpus]|uniref:heat shock 70 kDa protein 14-like n=1 Tax=Hydractinia symbiolongicarpus TaxID=13093 RepID=UPI00254F50F0|nr:heat shock 70 kDa protein 14-like [Hydractinia symbiolongicarpus]